MSFWPARLALLLAKFAFVFSLLSTAAGSWSGQSTEDREAQLDRLHDIAAGHKGPDFDFRKAAQEAKSRSGYRESDPERQAANWLSRAFEALGRLIERLLWERETRPTPSSRVSVGPWLHYLAWGGFAVVAFSLLWLIVRALWSKERFRRGGMLEDAEPVRTSDEWLERADRLAEEQRFRDAVRCLYLAILMRFDEYGVARFDRNQTNWEHHRRIMASEVRPPLFDFTSATSTFDHLWYGARDATTSDYDAMRALYVELCRTLRPAA